MFIEDQIKKAEEKFGVKKPAPFFTKKRVIGLGIALAAAGGAAFYFLKKKK